MKKLFILSMLVWVFCACQKEEKIDATPIKQLKVQEDCSHCDDIEIKLEEIENDDPECCTRILTVNYIDPCKGSGRQHIELNGEIVGFAYKPIHEFKFETCGKDMDILRVLGYNDEENEWNDVCFEEKLDCKKCNCRSTDFKFDVTKLSAEQDSFIDCCRWLVTASSENSSCKVGLKVGDEVFNLNQISISKTFEICDELTAAIMVNGEVCEEETLSCDCCDGITVTTEIIGSPNNSSLCKHRVIVENNTFCDQYINNQSGQIVGIIPQGESLTTVLWSDPMDGFFTTYYIGTHPWGTCKTIELSTICSEKG